jgi:hypothetical protein
MGKEILSAAMTAHLGSEPRFQPFDFGIEFIIRRINDQVHPIQVDQSKDGENIPVVERIASKGTDLIQVSPEIPMSKANGAKSVCLPLPGDETLDGQFLRLTFAQHNDAAHIFTQRV